MSTFVYPSPREILQQSKRLPISSAFSEVYAKELQKYPDEIKENQYLVTYYCTEVIAELTSLSFSDWIVEKVIEHNLAKSALKASKIIFPTRDVIELVPAYQMSIIDEVPNYVNRIVTPYGRYIDSNVDAAIARNATYNSHLLIQNAQSIDAALKAVELGRVNELTHVIYGQDEEYLFYTKKMEEVYRKLNEERYHTVQADEKVSGTSSVKTRIKTYKRIQ